MIKADAIKYINNRMPIELKQAPKQSNGYDTYICPFCGNGSGSNGDGLSTVDGKCYKCFKCDFYGDYLDILKKQHGTDDMWDIFTLYNIVIDTGLPDISKGFDVGVRSKERRITTRPQKPEVPAVDHTEYYKHCNSRASQTDYFSKRGISTETINRFMLGYDPAWKHPNVPNAPLTARVIIPASKYSYTARATNANAKSCSKMKVGTSELFNIDALQCTDYPCIYITEGDFDALSVIEAGGQAIALRSKNKRRLLQAIEANLPTVPLALSLDNDESGQNAQRVLKEQLEALKIPVIVANIHGGYKDANEALVRDRVGFISRVADPTKQADAKIDTYVNSHSVSGGLDMFIKSINNASTKAMPTGFEALDSVMGGGFYDELHILGAISGIGKTSLCLQIADQVTKGCKDVIIFSIEMSKHNLIAKSLSRLTFMEDNSKDKTGHYHARTSRQITTGAFHSERVKQLVDNALQQYRQDSRHLYIYEGGISVAAIREAVGEHVKATGNRPLVMVDYLQILAPTAPAASVKQNIDTAVTELKQISTEYKLPVLVVSSFNRDNYSSPVNMTSFKESGAIEYSSDVLIGLQFKGMDDNKVTMQNIEEWRKAECREIELKILKNRYGASGESICFSYYPRFNLFHETGRR